DNAAWDRGSGGGVGGGVGEENEAEGKPSGIPDGFPVARFRTRGGETGGSAERGRSVSFLLDTNVLSEWVKPQPSAAVARWLAEADEDGLFLSVVSLAELRRGVERLAES